MIKEKIAEIVEERIRICEETGDNWDYGIEQCWKKYIDVIAADIDKSIEYFLHECSEEEFYWLSEAFEEIAEKMQSKELISAWRSRLASVNPNNYNQQTFKAAFMRKYIDFNEYVKDIAMEIDYAEGRIDE